MEDKDLTAHARDYFSRDRFAVQAAGITIEQAREGYARCRMEITPALLNANGQVMGGALFTLADFAFAVATNCGEARSVTISSSIVYHSTVKGSAVCAETECLKSGRRTCSYLIRLKDGDIDTPIATVTTVGQWV